MRVQTEKMINVFEMRLLLRVHLIIHLELHLKVNFNTHIYKDAQEGAPDVALKGTLVVALELHFSWLAHAILIA